MSADRRKNKNTPGCTHYLQLVINKVITVIANRKLEVGDSLNEFQQIKARHGKLNDKNIKLRHVKIYLIIARAMSRVP